MTVPVDAPDGEGTQGVIRSSALVAVGTGLSRVTGFLALAAVAYALGFTRLTDTYNLANTTPNMVYELLLGGVLSATLVPVFVERLEDDDAEGIGAVVFVSIVALVALTAVGLLVAPLIIRLLTAEAPGATAHLQRHVANGFLRMFMPQVFFYGLIAIATALLHARRRFNVPAFAPALANLVEVALFFWVRHVANGTPTLQQVAHDRGLALLLGLGTTAAVASMAIPIAVAVQRSGRVRLAVNWRHPAVAKVFRLSGWTIGYAVANQVSLWVILVLANRHAGGVAAYQGAFVFFQLPHGLLAVSLMTTITPELARRATRGEWQMWRDRYDGGLRLLLLVVAPAATGYVVLARPLITTLLQRGAFSSGSASLTAHLLVTLAAGLPGFSVYLYTLRGFYALSDTRTPFALNVVQNVLTVVAALALDPHFGVAGLTAAIALAYTLAAVLALAALRRRVGGVVRMHTVVTAVRVFVACAVMGAAVIAVRHVTSGRGALMTTAVGVVAGIVVYVAGVSALRVSEARELVGVARRMVRR
ncbi:MAG TPA: murein biosynthesis integral membrane protein MurJ [Acidimicrobiales bacterium]|nr:murein biosynthesis integral membrane protein MurJ [Acidimicrobiales bacterium]